MSTPVPNPPDHNNPGMKEPGESGPTQPGKPGNDPDQTPNRETPRPPVADPGKQQEHTKVNPTPGK